MPSGFPFMWNEFLPLDLIEPLRACGMVTRLATAPEL